MERTINSSWLRHVLNNMEKPSRPTSSSVDMAKKMRQAKQCACNGSFLGYGDIQHHKDCKLKELPGLNLGMLACIPKDVN